MGSTPHGRPDCGSRSGPRWYVVQTKPREEKTAAERLARQGFEVYVPMTARQIRIGTLIAPLFPRYGFVQFDRERQRWRAIHSTPGVQRLFSASPEMPLPVAPGLVEEIKAAEADRLVVADLAPAFIRAGASIEVVDGPMMGATGVCLWDGRKRARVLLHILGRDAAVDLPRNHVVPD